MSTFINPSQNAVINESRNRHGYVAKVLQLPTANARTFGVVVFCAEDKRFYECVHVQTSTEDYYKWIATTSGAQRTYFIPVEKLTSEELPSTEDPDKRNNSFDAIISAVDEIVIGLYRYHIAIEPLCYKSCPDTVYAVGKKYYVWYDNYDRAEYVITSDKTPIVDKAYFYKVGDQLITKIFAEGESFEEGVIYYESTRPLFISDPAYVAGEAIDHWTFESNGQKFDELTSKELISKTNEIIDVLTSINVKISKLDTEASLFELATTVNAIIDEVNPFSNTLNNMLKRISALEQGSTASTTVLTAPSFLKKDDQYYKLDIYDDAHGIGFVLTRSTYFEGTPIELPMKFKKDSTYYTVDVYDNDHGIGFEINRC